MKTVITITVQNKSALKDLEHGHVFIDFRNPDNSQVSINRQNKTDDDTSDGWEIHIDEDVKIETHKEMLNALNVTEQMLNPRKAFGDHNMMRTASALLRKQEENLAKG